MQVVSENYLWVEGITDIIRSLNIWIFQKSQNITNWNWAWEAVQEFDNSNVSVLR